MESSSHFDNQVSAAADLGPSSWMWDRREAAGWDLEGKGAASAENKTEDMDFNKQTNKRYQLHQNYK